MRKKSEDIHLAATDLSNFLACRHLSTLDLGAAVDRTERPVRYGPGIDELRARGLAHEEQYLAHLIEQGLSVARVGALEAEEKPAASAVERTREVLASGADVVYQATLEDGTWCGRADFLVKVAKPSALGDWSYEVVDTKLARDTRAGTILRLCVHSLLLPRGLGFSRFSGFGGTVHLCDTKSHRCTVPGKAGPPFPWHATSKRKRR